MKRLGEVKEKTAEWLVRLLRGMLTLPHSLTHLLLED